MISLSGHLSGSICSLGVDIASTQNLLISFKPIICKLNYSHVIKYFITNTKVNFGPEFIINSCFLSIRNWEIYLSRFKAQFKRLVIQNGIGFDTKDFIRQ